MNKQVTTVAPEEALPADPMVSMIERVIMDPNAGLEKLERMLAMKERMDAETARRAFSDAMAACQAEMEPVARNKDNEQTRSKYADLSAIYKACKPICAKHGFSFSTYPASAERAGHMGVHWVLRHHGGHEEADTAEIPIDAAGMKGVKNKTDTHAFGSTASYARRYLFCMVFDVATGDDNDGNTQADQTPVSDKQFNELYNLIQSTGMDEGKFITAYGGDPENTSLRDFPARMFDNAVKRLKARQEKANA